MEKKMEERIKNVMSAVFEVSVDKINDNASPDTIESWDSLKHMNLIIALEEEFDVEISESETVELLSFKLISIILNDHGVV